MGYIMQLTKHIIIAAALALSLPAAAQLSASPLRFETDAAGYIERARAMRQAGNYAGVIDQLKHLDTQHIALSDSQIEEYTFLLAEAYYQRNDSECINLLIQFRNNYPASPLAPQASLAIGDYYFFDEQWPTALEAYDMIDIDRLNRDQKLLYSYRKGVCFIKTGHFAEARPLIATLKDNDKYADVYHFYHAYLSYIDGKFNDAYREFQLVSPSVEGLEAGYYMTQIEYTWGKYDDVIKHGESLLRKHPIKELAPEIQRIVGLSYFKQGMPDVAEGFIESYLTKIEGKATPEEDAIYAMAAIDYRNSRYTQAIERFSTLTHRQDAIGQSAYLYLGQCYLKQDNASQAAIAFEKATRMAYDNNVSETALYNYVTALTRGGKVPFSSAADLLETFIKRYPNSEYTPQVKAYLATAYYNDRNYEQSLRILNAITSPGKDIRALRQKVLYELGVESITNNRREAAIPYLKEAASMRNADRDIAAQSSLWLGDALFYLNRYSEAEKAYDAFVKAGTASPNYALGLYNLAYSRYKQSNYSGAAADFGKALKAKESLTPRLADDARIRRADCLYYTRDLAGAAQLYTETIGADATDADYALYRRAVVRGLQGNNSAKIADLQRIEKNYPDSRWLSKALLEEAVTYEETGRKDLAAEAYKKRLSLNGTADIDELLRMAAAMYDSRKWADLLDVTERIKHAGGLEADEIADINYYEAEALNYLNRRSEAIEIYESLAQNPSSLPGAKSAVTLAQFDLDKKNYEAARCRMEEFTDVGTPHQYWLARGFIALADAYHGLGKTYLAKEYLNSLNENYPATDDDIPSLISSRLKKWK